jgi:AcrR family transcriptional regulator
MTRAYHHGDLRTTLLDAAEEIVIAEGADAVSLRELARRAGVSHAAPRYHFPDRQALLSALAERGFEQLYAQIREAMDETSQPRAERLTTASLAFVTFARERAHLLELMFAKTGSDPSGRRAELAARHFELIGELVPDRPGPANFETRRLAFATMLQGIATLSAANRINDRQVRNLVDYAVELFDERGARDDDQLRSYGSSEQL